MAHARGGFAVLLLGACLHAQDVEDPGWPREVDLDGHKVVLYQPQVESWDGHAELRAKAAVAVTPKGEKQALYGALGLRAATRPDFESRTVLIASITLDDVSFPARADVDRAKVEAIVKQVFGGKSMRVSLDRSR